MNTTGLILSGILLAVLVAVSAGAMEMQTRLETLNQQLTQQRDELITLTQTAKAQMDASQAQLAQTEDQLKVTQAALNQAMSETAAVTHQQEELKGQVQTLSGQVQSLQAQLAESGRQIAQQSPANNLIPITGTSKKDLKDRLGLGLALAGVLALGSAGGVFAYTHSPKRIVTVRMTREQLKEYVRYQRDHGTATR